jgi:transposase-like protein
MKEAYIDLTICECPSCGNLIVEPSWFVVDLKQDFECAVCKRRFNTYENIVRKFMLKLTLDENGNIQKIEKKESKY